MPAAIDADLIRLNIKINDEKSVYTPVVLAVSPEANDNLILNSETVNRLLHSSQAQANVAHCQTMMIYRMTVIMIMKRYRT